MSRQSKSWLSPEDFAQYGLNEINIGGEVINTTDLIRRRWLDNDFYVINANVHYKNDESDFSFGAFYSQYHGDHFGEVIWAQYTSDGSIRDRYYNGDGKKDEFSLFAKMTYKVSDRLSLYGDLQMRFVDYRTSGQTSDRIDLALDKDYGFFNPKAGINFKLDINNNLYFSYARANREPARSDFENNVDIKPEQLNDFELGWRHSGNRFRINTNAYYMSYDEQLALTGNIDDTGAPIRENSGKSYRLGLEVEAAIQISDNFVVQPNFTISTNKNKQTFAQIDGEITDFGKTNISFSPEFIAANALIYRPDDRLQMSFLSKYVGEQFMGNTDSEVSRLDSYFVNDLNISYTIETNAFVHAIVISGLVNNVFNEEYVSNGYYFTYDDTWSVPGEITTIEGAGYYPQATTNFLIGATLKF